MGFSGSSPSTCTGTLKVNWGRGFYLKRQGPDAVIGGLFQDCPDWGPETLPKRLTRRVLVEDLGAASDDNNCNWETARTSNS